MSCFEGLMKEYTFASIDRFDGKNLSSRIYFLSHCHTDHMVGLGQTEFYDRLKNNPDIRLYCSEVTRALLISDKNYQRLKDHVTSLPLEEPRIIDLGNTEESLSVTLLPASHCPGSVMFLFEGREGTVLYTGDFRLPKGSGQRMRELHVGEKKEIRSMYVDTTFCIPEAMFIPDREQCLEPLIKLSSEWLAKSNNHALRLNLSAKYGYEYLYHALHDKFDSKIYCSRKDMYACLPETHKILTRNSNKARVFACLKKERIDNHEKLNFLNVTLSTMYFTDASEPWEVCEKVGEKHYRLCFSFHSSHSEVCDFIKYFRPRHVYANVIPNNYSSLEEISNSLRKDCDLSIVKENKYKPLGKIQFNFSNKVDSVKRRRDVFCLDEDSLESNDPGTSETTPSPKIQKWTKNSGGGGIPCIDDNDDFFVSASPGTLEPSQQDVDQMHLALARKYCA